MRYADELVESRHISPSKMDIDLKRISSSTVFSGSHSGRMSRATSFSQLNMQSKMESLEASLQEMASELRILQAQTSDSCRFADTITDQLNNRLETKHRQLTGQIDNLRKSIQIGTAAEINRLNKIKQRFDANFQRNLEIRNRFIQFRTRIECVEHAMGFYGAQEKYRS